MKLRPLVDPPRGGKLTLAEIRAAMSGPGDCPLCERPNYHPTDHHLIPKSKGGKVTKTCCRDCHKAIHAVFTNAELKETYHTVDALMGHEEFAAMVRFISKQDGRVNIKKTKRRRRRRP